MILRIIDEIEKALSHDLYFAALNLALTLPDICGKAEYPDLRTGERYKKWYDEIVGVTEKPPKDDDEPEMLYLSGEVVYSLRCSLLHEGNPNLQKSGKHPIPIDRFSLVIQSEQPFRIYGGEGSSVMTSSDSTEVRSYRVNVRRLCMVLCLCAEGYYKENKDKFDFYNYELIDWDKVTASLPPINMEEMFRKLAGPSLSEKEHSGESTDE